MITSSVGSTASFWQRALVALPLACGCAAYFGVWRGELLFDDLPALRDNAAIQDGHWWTAAFSAYSPVANRPLTCLSFVLDRSLFGPAPAGHHVTNLLLHLAVVVLVFAVVQAALRAPNLRPFFAPGRAHALAVMVSTLFAVHPLGVDAVAYVAQRSTLLMAGAFMLALWAHLRAEAAPAVARWRALTLVGLALGMASKEELAAAPLLLPLFHRAFVAADWRALQPRWPLFAAGAASWLVLLACVLGGPHNPTVGYRTTPAVSAWEWLLTQAGVVAHYLRLCVWPDGLRGCYSWPIVRELGPAAAPGLLILGLLAATTVACWRRPAWGFLGAWFFLLLAPTSTILPIITEPAAERRAYLPMLAVLVPGVLGIDLLARRLMRPWLFWVAGLAAVAALSFVTRERVAVYRNEASFWTDAHRQHDPGHRSVVASILLDSYGRVRRAAGDRVGARDLFAAAVQNEGATVPMRLHYAAALTELGEYAAAEPVLAVVAAEDPRRADEQAQMAQQRVDAVRRLSPEQRVVAAEQLAAAEVQARVAIGLQPGRASHVRVLGSVLEALGRLDDAESSYRRAVGMDADDLSAVGQLAVLLVRRDRGAAADEVWRAFLDRRPTDADLRVRVAGAYLELGELDRAAAMYADALRLQPGHVGARSGLEQVTARRPR